MEPLSLFGVLLSDWMNIAGLITFVLFVVFPLFCKTVYWVACKVFGPLDKDFNPTNDADKPGKRWLLERIVKKKIDSLHRNLSWFEKLSDKFSAVIIDVIRVIGMIPRFLTWWK